MWLLLVQVALAADFVVDDRSVDDDANPGDGTCATAGGHCTLPAALAEAEATAVADTIELPTGTITLHQPLLVAHPVTVVGAGRASTTLAFDGADLFEAADTVLDLRDLAVSGGGAVDGCIVGAGTDVFLERVDLSGCTTSGVSLTATTVGDPLGHLWLRDVTLTDHAGLHVVDPAGVASSALVVDVDGLAAHDSDFVLDTPRPWSIANAKVELGSGLDALGTTLGMLDHVVFRRTDRALVVDDGKVDGVHVAFVEGGNGAVQVVGDAQFWCDTCLFYANAGQPALDVPPFSQGGIVALDRSVFLLNHAPGDGGALRVRGGPQTVVRVRNTTFASNRADGNGGAIAVDSQGATLRLEHVSLGRNVADADDRSGGKGGGIYVAATSVGLPELAWSALADNRHGDSARTAVRDDCNGHLTRAGVNFVGVLDATACVVDGGVELKGTRANPLSPDWQIQQLATGLYGPVPRRTSPLVDAAIDSTVPGDQGGRGRPLDGNHDRVYVADVGAVERIGPVAP